MRRTGFACLVTIACSSGSTPPIATADAAGVTSAHVPTPVPVPAPYGAEVKSLRVRRPIAVRFEPREDAKSLGTINENTYVGFSRAVAGTDEYCSTRWVEIAPRGWICEKYLEPSPLPQHGVELPKVKPGEIVPGAYGKVRNGARAFKTAADAAAGRKPVKLAGAVTVRKLTELSIGGRVYWKTAGGEIIAARDIVEVHEPSRFQGIRLDEAGAPAMPFAWAQSRKDLKAQVVVRDKPDAKLGKVLKKLPPRTVVPVVDQLEGWVRIGEGEWVAVADLHVAREAPPPPETGTSERWLDVDLDEQVVVAYDGLRPAYATMVSSGSAKWPTPEGVYRVWIKFGETDMNGQMGDEEAYSVGKVPWTMFFARDLAFHTAYWHDRFGEPRSHGCLNLSPIDARALYFWATPDVPLGWSMSSGIFERPGSPVRIRSAKVPSPEFRGYAKLVHEAQLADRIPEARTPSPDDSATTTPDPVPDAKPLDARLP
jgi:lipoprotein-anchoring transpeptidase ErfK/SrfK